MKVRTPMLSNYISSDPVSTKLLWRNNLILFVALFSLIFVVPILAGENNFLVKSMLALVIFTGVFSADFNTRAFRGLLVMSLAVVSLLVLGMLFPEFQGLNTVGFFLATISLIIYTMALIYQVAHAKQVDKSTLFCAINSYLLIGLTGSILLIIIDLFMPGAVIDLQVQDNDLHTYFYFGFVTLTTLGYGDISPDGAVARSVSTFIALSGQLYLVIIMALIIGKFLKD